MPAKKNIANPAPPKAPARKTKPKPTADPNLPKQPHIVDPEELWADGTHILSFVLPGQPATKKTSQRIFRRRILPSKQYCAYEDHCAAHCLAAWVGETKSPADWEAAIIGKYGRMDKMPKDEVWVNFPDWVSRRPMDYGVSVKMKVYLRNWTVGDCTGYQQSIADIMQKFGVIANDSWLHWDWENAHWLSTDPDKDNPRVEIEIKRFRHPKEAYRAKQEVEEKLRQERAAKRLSAQQRVA
jgi:hypothetical protein